MKILKLFFIAFLISASSMLSQTIIPESNKESHPKLPSDGSTQGKFSAMVFYNAQNGRYYYFNAGRLVTNSNQIVSLLGDIKTSSDNSVLIDTVANGNQLLRTIDFLTNQTFGDSLNKVIDSLGVMNANLKSIKDAVEIIDDWDDNNYANANINISGTDVAGGEGVKNAQTIRFTTATDDTLLSLLNKNSSLTFGSPTDTLLSLGTSWTQTSEVFSDTTNLYGFYIQSQESGENIYISKDTTNYFIIDYLNSFSDFRNWADSTTNLWFKSTAASSNVMVTIWR